MGTILRSLILFTAFAFQFLHAAVPTSINFQGFATDAGTAQPLDGSFDITFNLYNVDSGGSPLWTETWNGANQVTIDDGVFNVPLGQLSAFGANLFGEPLFLGIVIGADSEMAPRQPLLSAPYALIAAGVDEGAIDSSMLGSDAVDTDNITDGSVTAAKINSTGLNADSIDGIDGSNIITGTGGGTINDADLQVSGTGQIIAGPAGMQFSDGTTQVSAAVQAIGLGAAIPVTCDPSGATTPLQDAIDTLGPGGYVVIEIDGVCKENVRARRDFLEIRGANGSSSDGIECVGVGPAFEVREPIVAWLSDLNLSCPGELAVRVSRNGVIGMYGFSDKVTITDSNVGAFAQYGGNLQMFGVETSGNDEAALRAFDGSVAYLSDVDFQESIDPDTHFSAVVEIGRNSMARIIGNNALISNSFFDAGGPTIGRAIDVFFNSEIRVQDVDGGAGVPTFVGAVSCTHASNMSLRGIDVSGPIDYFNCDGDFRDSSLQGTGSFDAYLRVNGGSVNIRGNTLDIAELGVNDYGNISVDSNNTFTGTEPSVYINNGSARIDADFTFDDFIANGPGTIDINGTLTDDSDASDDFQVNGVTVGIGGTINGNVYSGKNAFVNVFPGGSIEGRLTVGDKSIANISETGSVRDCIDVQIGSLIRLENGVQHGFDAEHEPCWTDGPSIFVYRNSFLEIGDEADVQGDINASGGAEVLMFQNSSVDGEYYLDKGSTLEVHSDASISGNVFAGVFSNIHLYGATISGGVTLDNSMLTIESSGSSINQDIYSEGSVVRVFGGLTFSFPGTLNLNHGSHIQLDHGATLELSNEMFLNNQSRLVTHDDVSLGRAVATDTLLHASVFSTLDLGADVVLTGHISLDDTSQLTSHGSATFNGGLSVGQAPSRANFHGAAPVEFGGWNLHCETNGVLKGTTPIFTTGSLTGSCDDQTSAPILP